MFDLTGSYMTVWLVAIGLSLVAALFCLPIDERTLERSPAGAAT